MTVTLGKVSAVLLIVGVLGSSAGDACHSAGFKRLSECCKIPITLDKDVYASCKEKYAEMQDEPEVLDLSMNQCLSAQCLFNASQLIDASGHIDAAKWKESLTANIPEDDQWHVLFDSLVDECVEKGKSIAVSGVDEEKCNPEFIGAGACLFHTAFLRCPADSYTSSPECDEVKELVRNCSAE